MIIVAAALYLSKGGVVHIRADKIIIVGHIEIAFIVTVRSPGIPNDPGAVPGRRIAQILSEGSEIERKFSSLPESSQPIRVTS